MLALGVKMHVPRRRVAMFPCDVLRGPDGRPEGQDQRLGRRLGEAGRYEGATQGTVDATGA